MIAMVTGSTLQVVKCIRADVTPLMLSTQTFVQKSFPEISLGEWEEVGGWGKGWKRGQSVVTPILSMHHSACFIYIFHKIFITTIVITNLKKETTFQSNLTSRFYLETSLFLRVYFWQMF